MGIMNTGDCMGDALRGQKKDPSKFKLSINSDGTLTFHSTWPNLTLKTCSGAEMLAIVAPVAAPSGKYCGSVPFILDMSVTFNSDGTVDFYNNVKIAHQVITCKSEKVSISGSDITFPNIMNTGDCMGDALRGQKKDPSKFKLSINSDGTLTFHSTWPNLTLKTCSEAEMLAIVAPVAAPTGIYCGSVPFILDMSVTFNSDGTLDFSNNVKIAHQDIECKAEPYTLSGSTITFPNIGKTGDCMGDALRKQGKDVSKFTITVNSDGSMTFHSTWPDLKLKQCDAEDVLAAPTGKYCGSVPFILDMSVTFN